MVSSTQVHILPQYCLSPHTSNDKTCIVFLCGNSVLLKPGYLFGELVSSNAIRLILYCIDRDDGMKIIRKSIIKSKVNYWEFPEWITEHSNLAQRDTKTWDINRAGHFYDWNINNTNLEYLHNFYLQSQQITFENNFLLLDH